MILKTLTFSNFGIFPGEQTVDLAPSSSGNIILFGGKNGSGKSTFLDAIRLCLYGQSAYPEFGSRAKYESYLESKIHHDPHALIQPLFGAVTLRFSFGEADGLHTFEAKRMWERKPGAKVAERFDLTRDGVAMDEISADYWQDFVRDLMPLGISQLFFFDGEKIQQLAEDESDQQTLAEAVKSMLGVDIVERLNTDLGIYRSRSLKGIQGWNGGEKLQALDDEILRMRARLQAATGEQHLSELKVAELKTTLQTLNEDIRAQGGNLARDRDRLIRQQSELKAEIERHESTIRELANGLMPFSVLPKLCGQLQRQLLAEDSSAQTLAVTRAIEKIKQRCVQDIHKGELQSLLKRSPKDAKSSIQERILELVTPRSPFKPVRTIHGFSPQQSTRMQVWIEQALKQIPAQLKDCSRNLEKLYRELQVCESSLSKAPADEILSPLLVRLQELNQYLGKATAEALAKSEQATMLKQQLSDMERAYQRLVDTAASHVGINANLELAARIQRTLSEYKGTIIRKRIEHLQVLLTECFNLLARKKDALRRIVVDPETFKVTLLDRRGHSVAKSQLSAGEKQIYAISVLWALAKASGRPLPMIIDTPLARLDLEHRQALAKYYFPRASHQTVILSTDTEIDQACFNELRGSISKTYQLEFADSDGGTFVRPGYFWSTASEAN